MSAAATSDLIEGYTAFGFDLDLNCIAGVRGGSIHVLLDDLQGQPFAAYWAARMRTTGSSRGRPGFPPAGPVLRAKPVRQPGRSTVGRLPAWACSPTGREYCTSSPGRLCRTPAAYTFHGATRLIALIMGSGHAIRIAGPFIRTSAYTRMNRSRPPPTMAGFPGPGLGLNYANGATIPVQFGYPDDTWRTINTPAPFPWAASSTGRLPIRCSIPPAGTASCSAGRRRWMSRQRGLCPGATDGLPAGWVGPRPDFVRRRELGDQREPDLERMLFAGAYYKGLFAERPNDTLGF